MTGESRVTMHKGAAALVGLALVLTGAGASYLFMGRSAEMPEQMGAATRATTATPPSGAEPSSPKAVPSNAPLPNVVVSLTTEAVDRAGIVVAPVASGTSAGEIRLPGIVEPNAYRQVVVTPLVAGRVTRVSAKLERACVAGRLSPRSTARSWRRRKRSTYRPRRCSTPTIGN